MGFCNGIEELLAALSGRKLGAAGACSIISRRITAGDDESHQSVRRSAAMYRGDRSRKETLVEYGFRLPSALDNRPLQFGEFERS